MAFSTADFQKIWASTSPLTPYEFTESNYKEGWNFIGSTPPARQMWDGIQKLNDEKTQYLYDKISVVGTVETDSPASDVSVSSGSPTTIASVSLSAGTWVVTGHIYIQNANITADKFYAVGLGFNDNTLNQADEGTMATTPSFVTNVSLQTTRILTLNATTTIYMCVLATANTTVNSSSSMTAVRIV